MGTTHILFGFLFLINPDLITLDILPDFIGYFLIARGLYRVSYLEERTAAARKFAIALAFVSFAKLLASAMTFSTRIESTRLTVSFFFFVLELAFSYFLCDRVFKGFQYLAIRHDGDLALKSYDIAKTFTTVFFIAKASLNFLPQIPVIFYPNIDADGDLVENYTEMVKSFQMVRSILFVVGALVLISLGIYTARILFAYFRRCRSDTAFYNSLLANYEEKVLKNERVQHRIHIKSAYLCFFLAFFGFADLYLDFINMIPKPLFALFVYFGLRSLSKSVRIPFWQSATALASFVLTCVVYAYRLIRLITDTDFPYTFPYDMLGAILGILGSLLPVLLVYLVLEAVRKSAAHFLDVPDTSLQNSKETLAFHRKETVWLRLYRKYYIIVLILSISLAVLNFSQYLFVGRSDLVVFLQWALLAVCLYLHKSSIDQIQQEVEFRLT